jgi:hypothetical protein
VNRVKRILFAVAILLGSVPGFGNPASAASGYIGCYGGDRPVTQVYLYGTYRLHNHWIEGWGSLHKFSSTWTFYKKQNGTYGDWAAGVTYSGQTYYTGGSIAYASAFCS